MPKQVTVEMHGEKTVEEANTVGELREKLESVGGDGQKYELQILDVSTGKVLTDEEQTPEHVQVMPTLRGA